MFTGVGPEGGSPPTRARVERGARVDPSHAAGQAVAGSSRQVTALPQKYMTYPDIRPFYIRYPTGYEI